MRFFHYFRLIQGILDAKKATTSPIMGRCSRGATHISSLLLTQARSCRSLRSLPPYRNQRTPCVTKKWAMHCFRANTTESKKHFLLKRTKCFHSFATSVQNSLCGYGCYSIPRPFNGGLPVFATVIFASRLRDPFTNSYSVWLSLPQTRFD